jgi:hypothetical protein
MAGAAVGAGAWVAAAAAGAFVGSAGASVAPQAARPMPAAVRALTRKKSRRLSLFSDIFSSSFFFVRLRTDKILLSDLKSCLPPFLSGTAVNGSEHRREQAVMGRFRRRRERVGLGGFRRRREWAVLGRWF